MSPWCKTNSSHHRRTHDGAGVAPRAEYIIGVDLGQGAQYSGLCVLERTEKVTHDDEKPVRRYGGRRLKRSGAVPAVGTERAARQLVQYSLSRRLALLESP